MDHGDTYLFAYLRSHYIQQGERIVINYRSEILKDVNNSLDRNNYNVTSKLIHQFALFQFIPIRFTEKTCLEKMKR